jgi:hypothetical protein
VYWPDPWDRWHVNVWVVVGGNHFMDENVGRHHVANPPYREIHRRSVARRAPTVRHVESAIRKPVPLMRINREQRDIRAAEAYRPPRPGQPVSTKYRSMVLPESERSKVQEYAPKVEREVLKPRPPETERKASPQQRERSETQKERQKSTKERKESTQQQKVRRR